LQAAPIGPSVNKAFVKAVKEGRYDDEHNTKFYGCGARLLARPQFRRVHAQRTTGVRQKHYNGRDLCEQEFMKMVPGSDNNARVNKLGTFLAGAIELGARRYRRWLPASAALIVLTELEPLSFEDTLFDDLAISIGVAFCMLGQLFRLWAWGCSAVVGKSGVRVRGPYALMRHPLYAGNFLIVVGLTVTFNNHWAYPLLIMKPMRTLLDPDFCRSLAS
jgi:isoprenylcysteine carboxyl methyltransferase (ICMT) family protein YpbQ